MGSSVFVEQLSPAPTAVVIIDMIGDENLAIYQEINSDELLTQEIWSVAASLGYEKAFPAQKKYQIIDDHLPFIKNNIPAVLLIDFDYPYWHTSEDTIDKVSAQSLKIVGDVVSTWIKQKMGEKSLP
jgi:Zn-dependent M28 family amino/carboxypeptidase